MKCVSIVSMLFGVVILLCVFVVCLLFLLIQKDRKQKQQMAAEKREYREIASTGETLEKWFFPTEMLELLNIRDNVQISMQNSQKPKELEAVILNANIADFSDKIQTQKMDKVYQLINEIMSCCIPQIYIKGGMIDRFQDAGVVALFTGDREAALAAAVSICEEIIRKEKENTKDFSIGLCYGNIMVGVVGAQKRLSVLTLSSYTGFGGFLQRKAPAYYATILAAESYTKQIEEFQNKYNYRFLGYFYIQAIGRLEAVYDVFDGDRAEIRNQKRKTKMLFEKGVKLFEERSFADARTYFIEVIKADRNDTAAREYIFRCDKYSSLAREEQKKVKIYLESF